jgi:hypothetical protein
LFGLITMTVKLALSTENVFVRSIEWLAVLGVATKFRASQSRPIT